MVYIILDGKELENEKYKDAVGVAAGCGWSAGRMESQKPHPRSSPGEKLRIKKNTQTPSFAFGLGDEVDDPFTKSRAVLLQRLYESEL